MARNGFREEEEEMGLELSLGLPGYFSRSPGLEKKASGGGGGATTGAEGSNGFKASRPAVAAPVVGWPPVRSFRRNLAPSSSKPSTETSNRGGKDDTNAKIEMGHKGLYVKINMDGVPIGRKVDLKAHGSYDKLSATVDQLFRGLLAAQRDPAIAASESCTGEKQKVIIGLLDGSGEYTLVYEDDEGDQMLVGDVPWDMFISTAKRLRVLRSSDLNTSSLRAVRRKRAAAEC